MNNYLYLYLGTGLLIGVVRLILIYKDLLKNELFKGTEESLTRHDKLKIIIFISVCFIGLLLPIALLWPLELIGELLLIINNKNNLNKES